MTQIASESPYTHFVISTKSLFNVKAQTLMNNKPVFKALPLTKYETMKNKYSNKKYFVYLYTIWKLYFFGLSKHDYD